MKIILILLLILIYILAGVLVSIGAIALNVWGSYKSYLDDKKLGTHCTMWIFLVVWPIVLTYIIFITFPTKLFDVLTADPNTIKSEVDVKKDKNKKVDKDL